jgi:signal transduction histidine kinase
MAAGEGLTERELQVARAAGLAAGRRLSLSDVERRRTQLWSLSLFVVVAVTVAIALLALGRDLLPEQLRIENLQPWVIAVLMAGFALAFMIYVIEKEMNLRRLTSLLVEERVRSEMLSARLSEISALSEVGKTMNSTLDASEVFDVILSSALEILGATEGSIMLADQAKKKLEMAAYRGPSPALAPAAQLIGSGIAGGVALTRRPLLLQGVDLAGELIGMGHPERNIYSAMSVPLERRGELLGVLNVNETEGKRAFDEDDLHVLALFAEYAAIAIGNAQQFEKEREAVARLEELDRLKSDFVATVSHELKTPLTTIIGAAKTLDRSGQSMSPEDHAQFMEMITRQTNRLLRLVEDVLTAARIESGTTKMRREKIALRELATTIIDDLEQSKIGFGRKVKLVCEPEQPEAWGDPAGMQQIVSNLVENALKYSADGDAVEVTIVESASEVTIAVRDEGQGIPKEQLDTIFQKFHQVDASSTRRAGGVGLGLYIVSNLVQAHNGSIEVDSEVGVGTTFTVRLPKRASDRT